MSPRLRPRVDLRLSKHPIVSALYFVAPASSSSSRRHGNGDEPGRSTIMGSDVGRTSLRMGATVVAMSRHNLGFLLWGKYDARGRKSIRFRAMV